LRPGGPAPPLVLLPPTVPLLPPMVPGIAAGGGGSADAGPAERLAGKKRPRTLRTAAGEVWEDPTLEEWPENDYRLWVGNLALELTSDELGKAFTKYPSFAMARVVPNRLEPGNNRGYGFVSFLDPMDMVRALDEMDRKYIGPQKCVLKRADTSLRSFDQAAQDPRTLARLIAMRKALDSRDPFADVRKKSMS
jgi:RNA recognition motif-containing protein